MVLPPAGRESLPSPYSLLSHYHWSAERTALPTSPRGGEKEITRNVYIPFPPRFNKTPRSKPFAFFFLPFTPLSFPRPPLGHLSNSTSNSEINFRIGFSQPAAHQSAPSAEVTSRHRKYHRIARPNSLLLKSSPKAILQNEYVFSADYFVHQSRKRSSSSRYTWSLIPWYVDLSFGPSRESRSRI